MFWLMVIANRLMKAAKMQTFMNNNQQTISIVIILIFGCLVVKKKHAMTVMQMVAVKRALTNAVGI